jgi:hypothetical protein
LSSVGTATDRDCSKRGGLLYLCCACRPPKFTWQVSTSPVFASGPQVRRPFPHALNRNLILAPPLLKVSSSGEFNHNAVTQLGASLVPIIDKQKVGCGFIRQEGLSLSSGIQ